MPSSRFGNKVEVSSNSQTRPLVCVSVHQQEHGTTALSRLKSPNKSGSSSEVHDAKGAAIQQGKRRHVSPKLH